VIGDLIAIDATKVEIQTASSSAVVAIPRHDVTRFEVRTQRSRKGRGAGIGALVGLGVGVAVGFAAGDDCGGPDAPSFVCISRPASAFGAGLAGAGAGALLGVLFAPGEKWRAVDQSGLSVSFLPPSGRSRGLGLALSLTF